MRQTRTQSWQSASPWQRWLAFNLVGLLGIAVQLGILAVLTLGFGWNYLVSTFLTVETAILHNFIWHERWTSVDRTTGSLEGRLRRLLRFHAANGAVSLLGNLVLMGLFVGILQVHPVVANIGSIAICSLVNFLASDRWVFRERQGDSMTKQRKMNSEGGGKTAGGHLLPFQRSCSSHEGKKPAGVMNVDSLDLCSGRPLPHFPDKLLQQLWTPFHHDLDRSVGTVADVPAHIQSPCGPAHEVAEADSLDHAMDNDSPG